MKQISLAAAVIFSSVSCAQETAYHFTATTDPGGCLIEHIAVAGDADHYQFDGLSPDGEQISIGWSRDEEMGMFLLNLKTGDKQNIPDLNNSASFSPDGNLLVTAHYGEGGATDILEYRRDTGEIAMIAPHERPDWLPSYSSDGKTILFNSFRSGQSEIYTYEKETSDIRRWTERDEYDAHGQFSPDDKKILFLSSHGSGDHSVSMIDMVTGRITQVLGEGTNDTYGSWSPSGDRIVFASDRNQDQSGATDIFVLALKDNSVRQITSNNYEDGYPFFSPDGRFIYFNSIRSERYGVYRVRLNGEGGCAR
ncbi:hypothetical protein PUV54_11640 [Hyphococcus flavus]|uniref:TolB protein n=1 Tax=Hyphococcus flavus TaxID=1866326 RepID=A0AAE9ZCT9_9PROT|nr:hypothetical protein [Hyphococcus flavus]WDI30607.1 hypothetical protein PUV54_11640 [Hyphococcus flavus]